MKPLYNPYFVKFIVYFNVNQDYFECHEELEEYWKSLPDGTKDHPLTGYILLATGMYHWRRGNTIGGLRTLKNANEKISLLAEGRPDFIDGIDFNELCCNLQSAINKIENGQPFASFQIAITSDELLSLTQKAEMTMDLLPFGSDAVIHKHMLRDRSDILRKRDEKKKGRIT